MPAKRDLRSRVVTANGAAIPALGFGTYSMSARDMLRMIPAALDAGFRHIDAAQIYGNEEEVGEGIARSGISRRDVFITTKVWVTNYSRARFAASVEGSLPAPVLENGSHDTAIYSQRCPIRG